MVELHKPLLLIIVASILPGVCMGGEMEERQKILDEISNLYAKEKFDKLTEIAKEFREKELRTPSGVWKLTVFYAAVADSLQNSAEQYKDEKILEMLRRKAAVWIGQFPNEPAGYIHYANLLVSSAYAIRGEGWAKDVKPENWKPFHEKIGEAKKYMLEHKETVSKDPHWYAAMMGILRSERNSSLIEFVALTEEMFTRHPYYYQGYFAAIDYLLPKWHGSKEDIEGFTQDAVERTREKEGMGMYARIYWYASQAEYGEELFLNSAVRWDQMKQGMDDVLKLYPDQWNINNFAKFACRAGDKSKCKELLACIKGSPIKKVWGNYYGHFARWASEPSDNR